MEDLNSCKTESAFDCVDFWSEDGEMPAVGEYRREVSVGGGIDKGRCGTEEGTTEGESVESGEEVGITVDVCGEEDKGKGERGGEEVGITVDVCGYRVVEAGEVKAEVEKTGPVGDRKTGTKEGACGCKVVATEVGVTGVEETGAVRIGVEDTGREGQGSEGTDEAVAVGVFLFLPAIVSSSSISL